jgi:hypothetical protein
MALQDKEKLFRYRVLRVLQDREKFFRYIAPKGNVLQVHSSRVLQDREKLSM